MLSYLKKTFNGVIVETRTSIQIKDHFHISLKKEEY